MPELESISNPQLKKSLVKIWDLIKVVVRQLNIVVDQNKDLKNKINNLQDLLEEKENLLQNINVQEIDNNLNSFSSTIAEKNLIIIDKNEEINKLNFEILNYQKRLEEFEKNKINDHDRINLSNLENEILKLNSEIAEKNWILTEIENSLKEKKSIIEKLTLQIGVLEADKNNVFIALESREKEFNQLRLEKEKIESELTKVKIANRETQKKLSIFENEKSNEITLFNTHSEELEHFKNEKSSLLQKISELTNLNQKYKNEISKRQSGLLPLNFDSNDNLNNDYNNLEIKYNNLEKEKKYFENKLINLENLLILKSEEIKKINSLIEQNKEDFKFTNKIIKNKLLDLKKIMLDKGII